MMQWTLKQWMVVVLWISVCLAILWYASGHITFRFAYSPGEYGGWDISFEFNTESWRLQPPAPPQTPMSQPTKIPRTPC